mgnify:CR=1 FL=1
MPGAAGTSDDLICAACRREVAPGETGEVSRNAASAQKQMLMPTCKKAGGKGEKVRPGEAACLMSGPTSHDGLLCAVPSTNRCHVQSGTPVSHRRDQRVTFGGKAVCPNPGNII